MGCRLRADALAGPTGRKTIHHPVVGELTLACEAMDLAADTGLTLHVYTAEPASRSADALSLLASWAATQQQATTPATEDAQYRP
jgi:hypothetical protein